MIQGLPSICKDEGGASSACTPKGHASPSCRASNEAGLVPESQIPGHDINVFVRPITADMLQETTVFKRCSRRFLESFSGLLQVELFCQGDTIMHEGDRGDKLFYLNRGTVDVFAGGDMVKVKTLGKGNIFGEMIFFGNARRSATIVAAELCDCRFVHTGAFKFLLRSFPAEYQLFKGLAGKRQDEVTKLTRHSIGAGHRGLRRSDTTPLRQRQRPEQAMQATGRWRSEDQEGARDAVADQYAKPIEGAPDALAAQKACSISQGFHSPGRPRRASDGIMLRRRPTATCCGGSFSPACTTPKGQSWSPSCPPKRILAPLSRPEVPPPMRPTPLERCFALAQEGVESWPMAARGAPLELESPVGKSLVGKSLGVTPKFDTDTLMTALRA